MRRTYKIGLAVAGLLAFLLMAVPPAARAAQGYLGIAEWAVRWIPISSSHKPDNCDGTRPCSYMDTNYTPRFWTGARDDAYVTVSPSPTPGPDDAKCVVYDGTHVGAYKLGACSSSGSMAIGAAVGAGTSQSVLYVDGSGNLGQDNSNLNYNAGTKTLLVGASTGVQSALNYGATGAGHANIKAINSTLANGGTPGQCSADVWMGGSAYNGSTVNTIAGDTYICAATTGASYTTDEYLTLWRAASNVTAEQLEYDGTNTKVAFPGTTIGVDVSHQNTLSSSVNGDNFTYNAAAQTLTNKTISASSNTITGLVPSGQITWSPADDGTILTPALQAGSFTVGLGFQLAAAGTVAGVRFYYPGPSSFTVKASLWDNSHTRQGSCTVTVSTAGIYSCTFTPVSVPKRSTWYVSYWENSGTDYWVSTMVAGQHPAWNSASQSTSFVAGPYIILAPASQMYQASAGDAYPSGTAGGFEANVEPVFSVP